MDISKRLTILVVIVVIVITILTIKETFFTKPHIEQGKSFLTKINNVQNNEIKNNETKNNMQDSFPLPIDQVEIKQEKLVKPYLPEFPQDSELDKVFTKQSSISLPQPPKGFFAEITSNYLLFREAVAITKEFTNSIDEIHSNFILDIIPFSIEASFERFFLMLFKSQESFTTYTLRPAWSQAATDVKNRAIYIMENNSFRGNFVHELSHIYFDGFFAPKTTPLWLSEGLAVYMQSLVQNSKQNYWLYQNALLLSQKEYITFDEFFNASDLADYKQSEVELWYAQAYSVVRYLITKKGKDGFYQFCKNIKEGMPFGKALYRAYGMPFNSAKALEFAWQASLQKDIKESKYAI